MMVDYVSIRSSTQISVKHIQGVSERVFLDEMNI